MKTSKCLLAASVALFAGNCDMVEGSALPVDGQQSQVNAASAIAPVSDEFLECCRELHSIFTHGARSKGEKDKRDSKIWEILPKAFPGVNRTTLSEVWSKLRQVDDGVLSDTGLESRLVLAFGVNDRDVDSKIQTVIEWYKLARKNAKRRKKYHKMQIFSIYVSYCR